MEVRIRHRVVVPLAVLAAVLLVPATAFADSVATTDAATNVTFTSATLNGTINAPQDGSYFFEWGTPSTSCRGHTTPPSTVHAGFGGPVSANITNLTPGVTYCYHLVVEQVYEPNPHTGLDVSFTTPCLGCVATTGDPTSVNTTSAILNGVVNTTSPNSAWSFQYGTTTTYGAATQSRAAGAGLTVVSVRISGLKPGTRYHFRLIVAQGTAHFAGNDHNFKTSRLVLRKRRLRVLHRKVSIPLSCKGQSGAICQGTLRITVHGKRVRCTGGQFSLHAGDRTKLKKTVRGRCLRLLRRTRHHSLRGRFQATFGSLQGQLKRSIKLFG